MIDVAIPRYNPLGRNKVHDERSRAYGWPRELLRGATEYPSVTHRMDSDHLDQFYLGACVGFTGAQFLNCRIAAKTRMKWNVRSPRTAFDYGYLNNDDGITNYSGATNFDPFPWAYPPQDGGSSALGLMKYWKTIGLIRGYRWAFNFDQLLSALIKQPVLIGTDWYSGMTQPRLAKRGRWLAVPEGIPQGGHEYLANGVLFGEKLIRCEQSWGENIDGATFYVAFEHMEWLLSKGGDVAIPELV